VALGVTPRRFVILDRDGTIIEERHHLASPDGVALIPGAADAIRRLRELGLGVIVATNQSVVGRGLVDEAGLEEIHDRVRSLLEEQGTGVDAIYHCPHLPDDGCDCRKPLPGLVERAAGDLGFDPAESFLVGDHAGDMELGRAVGATTIFVLTGHGEEERDRAEPLADHVAPDLAGAAAIIRGVLSREAT
jgi:D-glycero-D-manno-heptose 1,7-bisphosphate phosphatase